MDENLQEFVDSRDARMRIDRHSGVIRGVKLLGLQSRNGRRYLPTALAAAVPLYEGAKVNVNHPKGSPLSARDYQDRLGSIRNVSVRSGEGLYGDLHFNPKHALAEQLLWDADHAPENVGFSHNVEARTSRQDNQTVVEAILKVHCVDLVADPATTRGLYESAAASATPDTLGRVTLDELRGARPDLVEAIEEGVRARFSALEIELDHLRACEGVHQRRAVAQRLLREFKLPDPQTADSASPPMVSELFFESLLSAPDERAMRALVEERASMLAAARRLAMSGARPVSREQYQGEYLEPVTDAKSFARAIS